jgi:SRSO17 transposase
MEPDLMRTDRASGWSRWLLMRRSLTPNGTGELELVCYLCCAPTGTADEELIRVAEARCAVEECFQTAKTEAGLDHYQVRRYDAWYATSTGPSKPSTSEDALKITMC